MSEADAEECNDQATAGFHLEHLARLTSIYMFEPYKFCLEAPSWEHRARVTVPFSRAPLGSSRGEKPLHGVESGAILLILHNAGPFGSKADMSNDVKVV